MLRTIINKSSQIFDENKLHFVSMQQHDIPDCINLIDLSFGKNIHNEQILNDKEDNDSY